MQRDCLIAGFLVSIMLGVQPSEAQYTANFQTNIISGVTSNWSVVYIIGNNNFADALLIENGGVLKDGGATVGNEVGGSNNSVLVTGTGSIWSNATPSFLSIGGVGAGNSLVISDGGVVGSFEAMVGQGTSSSNNLVLVTGPSSVWSNNNRLYVGVSGAGNSLVISNGGQVLTLIDGVIVGVNSGSNSNSVLVTDSGSVWDIRQSFTFGQNGNNNTLVISNGGMVAVGGSSLIGSAASSGNNSILVTDSGSVWSNSGPVTIGDSGAGNTLVIRNGGRVFSGPSAAALISGVVGLNAGSNTVLVSDPNSAWNNSADFFVGYGFGSSGNGNSLVISNGAEVTSADGYLTGTSNSVLVSGAGSVWSNRNDLYLGQAGPGNSLVISNSGQVIDSTGYLGGGEGLSGSSNSVTVVTDSGLLRSAWRNNVLYVGYLGSANSLEIAGGLVTAKNVVIGAASPTCDNILELDSGNLMVTNNGTGVLEVRNGQLILNGGTLQVDTLVITNSCAEFVHTGGTLIVGNVVLDPNTFRIVSVARQSNDLLITWMMGPGATNALQVATGGADGSYTTNGFTDIFVVTNNTMVGTVTNYLDVGGATNVPARYYRGRLAP
jgi:T5SS/PEP-CTERM-associated repeat protein